MARATPLSVHKLRKTNDYCVLDLPLDTKDDRVHLIDLGALRVHFQNSPRLFDVGSLIYTDRKAHAETQRGLTPDTSAYSRYAVNIDTYRSSRKEPLARFVEYLFIEAKIGSSAATLEGKVSAAMQFMNWCDAGEYASCLDDAAHAREAFRAYVADLEHRSKIYEPNKNAGLKINSAVRYQSLVRIFLTTSLNIHVNTLVEGVRQLVKNANDTKHTLAPDHKLIGENLALWSCLFHEITRSLLSGKQYPFEISLPQEAVWVFPSQNPFLTKFQSKIRKAMFAGFDRTSGRMLDGHEMKASQGYTLSTANQQLKGWKRTLNEANNNLRDVHRYRLAKIAHDAFFMMFMLYTRTRADIRHIQWIDDCGIEGATSLGFKIIKARANGKICEYQVSAKFTKEFKLFLKLRKWLLDGQRFQFLFLRREPNGKLKQASPYAAAEFNLKVIRGLIDSDFPALTPSQCRTAGADYILNKYDVATAATMLQNRQSTLKKHYSNGNHQRASQQFTEFFSKLRQRIYIGDGNLNHTNVPSGHCAQFDIPRAELNAPMMVNCHTPQGCLYCEHFAIHADETDIRKLLSLEYIIKETKTLAHTIEHFESIYGGLLNRIAALLGELSHLNEVTRSLVARVQREVYEDENLSRYWGNKLGQLVRVGVL